MENTFKADEKVLTKVKGADVEATVTQVFNNEVQVKTIDGKVLWRTMHTVWYPGSQPIPKPVKAVVPPVAVPSNPAGTTPAAQPQNGNPSTAADGDSQPAPTGAVGATEAVSQTSSAEQAAAPSTAAATGKKARKDRGRQTAKAGKGSRR